MIRLPRTRFPSATRETLLVWQENINNIPAYADRVTAAEDTFKRKNVKSSAVFRKVKECLTIMCSGVRRCCYCEDSLADEVEHVKPKNLYPENVFIWENYLYACGPCNGPKRNQFAIIDSAGSVIEVARKPRQPVIAPSRGKIALINPRKENPLEFMELDLRDTFFFVPIHDPPSIEFLRASYTIKILDLNRRDLLARARMEAFGNYRARLKEYVNARISGEPTKALKVAIKDMAHPTVWAEIKRQKDWFTDLADLFDRAPEAMDW